MVEVFDKVSFHGAARVIDISIPKPRRGRERAKCPGLDIFHHEVHHNNRDWRAHGSAMHLPMEGVAERKVSGIEAELKQGGDLS